MWFDVQRESGGGAILLYVLMELVRKREAVCCSKKNREEKCGLLKGENHFKVRKRLLYVQKIVRGRGRGLF